MPALCRLEAPGCAHRPIDPVFTLRKGVRGSREVHAQVPVAHSSQDVDRTPGLSNDGASSLRLEDELFLIEADPARVFTQVHVEHIRPDHPGTAPRFQQCHDCQIELIEHVADPDAHIRGLSVDTDSPVETGSPEIRSQGDPPLRGLYLSVRNSVFLRLPPPGQRASESNEQSPDNDPLGGTQLDRSRRTSGTLLASKPSPLMPRNSVR